MDAAFSVREASREPLTDQALLRLSEDWAAENSCRGYRANTLADLDGNRVFLAESGGAVVGYLFGRAEKAKRASSIMNEGTRVFEVEEIYVKPEWRSKGVGRALFSLAESAAMEEGTLYVTLSTASKDWKRIFHFYLDELGMEFWNARLFKKLV